jgi:hypothetical protein
MDFNEIFEHNQKRSKYHHGHSNHDHDHDHDHDYEHGNSHKRDEYYQTKPFYSHQNELKALILNKFQNPRMRSYLFAGGAVVLLVILIVIILLFPLLTKFIHFLGENGIQGVLDAIWKGTK